MRAHRGRPHEDAEKTASHLLVRERRLRRKQTCSHLLLGLPASRTVSKYISIVQVSRTVVFCSGVCLTPLSPHGVSPVCVCVCLCPDSDVGSGLTLLHLMSQGEFR